MWDVIEENSREVWAWPTVEDIFFDIRYGLRALSRSPVFTAVALLTIAIGIAANAAVFSVVNSVLLKPLNYPKAEELVALHQVAPGAEGLADFESGLLLSPSMYFTYAEHNQTFESLGVWVGGTANVTGMAEPEQVRTVAVSDGVLQTLGVPPAVGRWFSQADQVPNGPGRVMLSYGYWQTAVSVETGRSLDETSWLIRSPEKSLVSCPKDFDLSMRISIWPCRLAFDRGKLILAGFGFHGIARLRPGATIAQANADLTRMLPIWMDSLVERPRIEPAYLRNLENHADDSPVETASDRQRGRTAVGRHGNDWAWSCSLLARM